jgi:hypothetical protein
MRYANRMKKPALETFGFGLYRIAMRSASRRQGKGGR